MYIDIFIKLYKYNMLYYCTYLLHQLQRRYMISFSDDDEEVLSELNVVEIIGTDTIDRDGLPIVEVDIKWNGLSIGEGQADFDEIMKPYIDGKRKPPQSVLFLNTAIVTFLGDM